MTEWTKSDTGELLGFDDFVSLQEAAQILRVSEVTLRRWIKDGRVRAYRFGPRRIRLRRADLELVVHPTGAGKGLVLFPMSSRRQTGEEVARALALHAKQLAARGGKPFPEAWRDINEMREDRSRHLE